jgi:hypothetical protein
LGKERSCVLHRSPYVLYKKLQSNNKRPVRAALNYVPFPAAVGATVLEERVPACRARRVHGQPHIDARDMEAVVAPREHAHLLAVVELAETDCTFSGRDAGFGLVHHHRYPPHQLPLLQPGIRIRSRSHGGGGVRCGHDDGAAATAVDPEAADEGVEADGADEDTEHRREDDDHVGVEASVAPASVRLQDIALRRRRGRWRDEQRRRGCINGGGGVIVSEHAHADGGLPSVISMYNGYGMLKHLLPHVSMSLVSLRIAMLLRLLG